MEIDGLTGDYYGQLQMSDLTRISVLESGVELPAAVVMASPADVATGGALASAYEGVLIETSGEVTSLSVPTGPGDYDPNGEFLLSGLRVNDFLYALSSPEIGDALRVTGVLRFANQDFKLEPREGADVEFLGLGSTLYLNIPSLTLLLRNNC